MSLQTDALRTIFSQLDVICVRAGVAIDGRWQEWIDDGYACVKEIEDQDKRLPCRCHLNDEWEETDG
jgi:hypothetical protein